MKEIIKKITRKITACLKAMINDEMKALDAFYRQYS
jgi:hypothetical protein